MSSQRFVLWISMALLVVAVFDATGAVASTMTYDFENLPVGSLPSTPNLTFDNWASSVSATTWWEVTTGTGADTTKVLHAVGSGEWAYRPNSYTWSDTASASFQADLQYKGTSQFMYMGPSVDGTDAGTIPGDTVGVLGERGPAIGIVNGNLMVREAYWASGGSGSVIPVTVAVSSISGLDVNDWISLKEVINPKDDTVTLEYRNVTDGTGWTSLGSGAANLSLTAAGKLSGFNAIFAVDNSALSQQAVIDNILIAQIPEPATFVLCGMALVGLLAYAWRRQK